MNDAAFPFYSYRFVSFRKNLIEIVFLITLSKSEINNLYTCSRRINREMFPWLNVCYSRKYCELRDITLISFRCNLNQTPPILFTEKRERKDTILFNKRERLCITIAQLAGVFTIFQLLYLIKATLLPKQLEYKIKSIKDMYIKMVINAPFSFQITHHELFFNTRTARFEGLN